MFCSTDGPYYSKLTIPQFQRVPQSFWNAKNSTNLRFIFEQVFASTRIYGLNLFQKLFKMQWDL